MPKICERALRHGQRVAAIDRAGSHTYAELYEGARRVAGGLLRGDSKNLGGARIAFLVEGSADYIKVQWGIWLAGGIAVPVSLHHPLPAIEYLMEDTGATHLLVSNDLDSERFVEVEGLAEKLTFSLARIGGLLDNSRDNSEGKPKEKPNRGPTSVNPTLDNSTSENPNPAMILYTSGTTSQPKGVVSTHAGIEAQITTLVEAWEWSAEDQIVCVLPLHHVHGIVNVMSCALWMGACVHFLPKFSPPEVFKVFQERPISLFMAVPTIYFKLIAHYEELPEEQQKKVSARLQTFRLMVSGSAALPVSVLEKWREISGHTLLERYGMTEIGMAISNPYSGERRAGYIGQPLPGVQVRLVEEDGAPAVAAPTTVRAKGQVMDGTQSIQGEIQVKGPAVFKEYWQKPEATRDSFTEEGWFKTGDVAAFENGSYRILGRTSIDIIKSGGYKISALEIEEVLRLHPAVKDCGVIGLADEEWGEIVAVCLVPEGEAIDEPAFQEWMRERLPAYRVPRQILQLPDLPRNALGKVTKKELRQHFENE